MQINAIQQQLAMQQGTTAAVMQQSTAAIAENQRAVTPTASNCTNNRGGNWQQQAWNNTHQAPYCPPVFNAMPNSNGKPNQHRTALSKTKTIISPTAIASKTITQAKLARHPAPITIQAPPNSTPWADPTPGRTRTSCRRGTAANPAPDLSVSLAQVTHSGAPQDSLQGPITRDGAGEDSNKTK